MKKLYLICDEWENDKNFVGSELNVIKQHFDVTVIYNGCGRDDAINDEASDVYADVRFITYYRKTGLKAIMHFIRCFADKAFYKELRFLKNENITISKVSEIIRFYINGELFYDFLKKNDLIRKDEDTIYYTYWYFWKCFALTKHKKEFKNSGLITRVHGYDLYRDQIPTSYQPFKHFMDGRLDKICFIAEHGMKYYLNTFHINRADRHVLCKLGTKDFGTENYKKCSVMRIVSCATLIELKRIHLIPEALSLISDIEIEWTHFGDGELEEDISNIAEKCLASKPNITFRLAGRVPNADIMEYYRNNNIDAFIMTSRSEGNPVSVIEAMSFGIPVIAANISNIPNLVKGNGIIISENPEPKELADTICDFAKLREHEIIKMRNKSREIWEQEYRADINNRTFVEEVLMKL